MIKTSKKKKKTDSPFVLSSIVFCKLYFNQMYSEIRTRRVEMKRFSQLSRDLVKFILLRQAIVTGYLHLL